MTIPVMKPYMGEEEAQAASEAVLSGWVAQGPRVAQFEAAFAGLVRAEHAVAVSSCTTGLHLALILMEVGPGDEVVVPSFSFIATANAVRYVGATPVFADVEADTGNVSVETVQRVVTPRTRAVIGVHQGGMPLDLDALRAYCAGAGLELLEDAACASGSTYRGAPVGAGARIAAWSFHPRKLLTTGEGGMVTTDVAEWAERGRRLREHAMSVSAAQRHLSTQPVREAYLETGYNFRMTDIQAAVGLVQLGRLAEVVERRRLLAARYRELLADVPTLRPVQDPAYGTSNFQAFWVEVREDHPTDRDGLLAALAAEGISARAGIMAAHRQPAYEGHPHGDLAVTERLTDRTLILPLFHTLTENEQDQVVQAVRATARVTAGR